MKNAKSTFFSVTGTLHYVKNKFSSTFKSEQHSKPLKSEEVIQMYKSTLPYKIVILSMVIVYNTLLMFISTHHRIAEGIKIAFTLSIFIRHARFKQLIRKLEDPQSELNFVKRSRLIDSLLIFTTAMIQINWAETDINSLLMAQIFFVIQSINHLSMLYTSVLYMCAIILRIKAHNILELTLTLLLYLSSLMFVVYKMFHKIQELHKEVKKHIKVEEMYSNLLNSTNDCIIIISADQKLLYQNTKSVKDFDFKADNVALKFKQITCSPSGASLYSYIANSIAKNVIQKTVLCQYSRNKDFGKTSEYEVSCQQLYMKRRIAIFFKDITESVELRCSKNQERFQQKVICSISHELLNPVNIIVGSLEILTEKNKNKETAELLDTLNNNTLILSYKIKDFIDYGTICNGTFKPKYGNFKLGLMLEKLFKICSALITGDETELRFNVNKNIPDELEMDSVRVTQILLKLLSNAIKHTIKGKVDLNINQLSQSTLHLEVSDTGSGIPSNIISYIETETLIDENNKMSLSKPPMIIPNTANIGLLTIKKMLASFGSKMDISTGKNGGTRICFLLDMYRTPKRKPSNKVIHACLLQVPNKSKEAPSVSSNTTCLSNTNALKTMRTMSKCSSKALDALIVKTSRSPVITKKDSFKLESQDTMVTKFCTKQSFNPMLYLHEKTLMEVPDEESNISFPLLKKKKDIKKELYVLLVDDMKQNRILFKRFLKELEGINILEFGNGKEVFQYIKNNKELSTRYHIIFMDIDMPVMNGIDATRNILNIPNASNSITIIAVSAFKETKDVEACTSVGMSKHMAKPVEKSALISTVKSILERNI